MTNTSARTGSEVRTDSGRSPAWRWVLIALEVLIAANAYYGGVGLVLGGLGMPEEWLEATPFDSWVVPGIALLLLIALPMTVAAAAEVTRARWAYPASVVAGIVQILWIVVQVVMLQQYFFLQPTLFVLGGLIVLLAWLAHRPHPAA